MAEENNNTEQLRAQAAFLLSQAKQQSFDIQRALGGVNIDNALSTRLSAAAAQISGAIGTLSDALGSSSFPLRAADLTNLESVIQSSEASTLVAEATAQATSGAVRTQTLATASAAARQEAQTLSHDMFERHVFDPYLHFDSAEDESDYRKRQAADQKYINEQLARGDDVGNLNASSKLIGSMLDAHAHGAGDSPEFAPDWNALVDKTARLHAAVKDAGHSTAEADRNLVDGVRRFLKTEKHLSDAEIDKRLAGSADPLDAVRPFIKGDVDRCNVENQIERSAEPAAAVPSSPVEAPAVASTDGQLTIDFGAMDARLQAAGLQPSGKTDTSGHGLAVAKPSAKDGQGITG